MLGGEPVRDMEAYLNPVKRQLAMARDNTNGTVQSSSATIKTPVDTGLVKTV